MADRAATVRDLAVVLETYFPPTFSLHHAIYILMTLSSFYTLLCLHQNQIREPRQPELTAWRKIMHLLLLQTNMRLDNGVEEDQEDEEHREVVAGLHHDIETVVDLLGLNMHGAGQLDIAGPFHQSARLILVTNRLNCKFCGPNVARRSLRLDRSKMRPVRILTEGLKVVQGSVLIAECSRCNAIYYPDKYTYKLNEEAPRRQMLEAHPTYLCISKSGVWVHHGIANMQEKAMHRFTGGWSNFATFITDLSQLKMTRHQAKRLYMEHFARRLLVAHGKLEVFYCRPHPSLKDLASSVVDFIGKNGGVLPNSLTHGCKDCTHQKRFREDLIREGIVLAHGPNAFEQVADIPGGAAAVQENQDLNVHENGADNAMENPVLGQLPVQVPDELLGEEEEDLEEPTYIQMAVMDGKTVGHRICAFTDCKNPLVNYKNGRFCATHLASERICGIIPCGRDAREGAKTCDAPAHKAWEEAWNARFKRLPYTGVRRVIRRQEGNAAAAGNHPTLTVELPPLGDIPGNQVVHTFRAESVYCLQTIQWACGMPIGWGKCYKSESQPQVLAIMDSIWANEPNRRPAFLAYDDACDLLRYIVTQHPESPWLTDTRLIVDAWHYVGHRSVDALCRQYCNPAPTDGSQPDLVRITEDRHGVKHLTRAFNTETAEQLNAWLTGYEAQLRQMTDVSYDFFVHTLMLVFAETVEAQIAGKKRGMDDLSDIE